MKQHGFVRLVDSMPRENGDLAIVQAARVSYGDGTTKNSSDEGLIRYLMRHWHTTPFEMVEFKFHIKMPIFVARQHLRHRTASVNEISARYSVVKDEYYIPETMRGQATTNKQGSSLVVVTYEEGAQESVCKNAFEVYQDLVVAGAAREISRCHLPQSTYTEFYWKINLHNLLHYLHLRMDSHAQEEIREFANEIYSIVEPIVPLSMKAFRDFRLSSIQLTGPEVEWLREKSFRGYSSDDRDFCIDEILLGGDIPTLPTKRETSEFVAKLGEIFKL